MLNEDELFILETADVQANLIGLGAKVWQYAVGLEGAKIGSNRNINSHCFIEDDVIIGDNVMVNGLVQFLDGITIKDNGLIYG